jgi:hypothetical protein
MIVVEAKRESKTVAVGAAAAVVVVVGWLVATRPGLATQQPVQTPRRQLR